MQVDPDAGAAGLYASASIADYCRRRRQEGSISPRCSRHCRPHRRDLIVSKTESAEPSPFPGNADRPAGRSGVQPRAVFKVAAVLVTSLLACIAVYLFVLQDQQTAEEELRGPAVVKGCEVRGSRVVVTAEVFNPREHAMTLSMIYWATDASGSRLTNYGEPLPSVRLRPGQRTTMSGTAEFLEGADQAKLARCEVSVR